MCRVMPLPLMTRCSVDLFLWEVRDPLHLGAPWPRLFMCKFLLHCTPRLFTGRVLPLITQGSQHGVKNRSTNSPSFAGLDPRRCSACDVVGSCSEYSVNYKLCTSCCTKQGGEVAPRAPHA